MNYGTDDLNKQCFNFFEKLFPAHLLHELENSGQRNRKLPPLITLKAFMYQCLSPNNSCRSALVYIVTKLNISASLKTSAYCRARKKLNTELLKQMAKKSGEKIASAATRILWVDGSIFQMWDSLENRKQFPHSSKQKIGLGQPVIRALGLFSAKTGAFIDLEFGKFIGKGQAETSLLRKLLDRLFKGDILIMDRFFSSLYLLQQIQKRKVDFVVRLRDKTAKKLIKKYKIKKHDGVVFLSTAQRSAYPEDQGLEQELKVRLIKSQLQKKGFRSKNVYVVTSIFNQQKKDIELMYADRWGIEVAYRNLKKTMGLSFIKAKTPEMVEKEIWVTLMTYNLIICTINLTQLTFLMLKQISFKTAAELLFSQSRITLQYFTNILKMLATSAFESPYRCEPRAIKKRNSKYPFLTKPRKQSRSRNWDKAGRKKVS